jgi:hypothetical protein
MKMTEQQQLARGKNVMLSLLDKRLSVPRMYLDVKWQGNDVDLLAIDRDGSGDVHVVLAYVRPLYDSLPDTHTDRAKMEEAIEKLSHLNAQYKYILAVAPSASWKPLGAHPTNDFKEKTFSPDGLGRVGIALATPDQNGVMAVDLIIFPERFRAFVGPSADDFVKQHPADWEVRALV